MSRRGLLALVITTIIFSGTSATPVVAVGSGLMDQFRERQAEKQRARRERERLDKEQAQQQKEQQEEQVEEQKSVE